MKSIVVEGIISIHAREHPILIKEKLLTFVPAYVRYKPEDIIIEDKPQSSLSAVKEKLEEEKVNKDEEG